MGAFLIPLAAPQSSTAQEVVMSTARELAKLKSEHDATELRLATAKLKAELDLVPTRREVARVKLWLELVPGWRQFERMIDVIASFVGTP